MWPPAFYFSHWPFQATWDNTRSILVIVTSLGLTGCRVICFSDDFGLFLLSWVLGEGAQSVCFSSLFFLLLPHQWMIFFNKESVITSVLMTHSPAPDLLYPIQDLLLSSLLAQLSLTEIWVEFIFFPFSCCRIPPLLMYMEALCL